MILRISLCALILLSSITVTQAQRRKAPKWLDPYQRQIDYPADDYLIGLSSEKTKRKKGIADLYKQLNQLSRNQLIEAIRVEVLAETEMNISIVNTQASERLTQNSFSRSEAELVGLRFENHYDRRKKLAYSFSYVSIPELAAYHRKIVTAGAETLKRNIRESNAALVEPNKQRAIRLLYESQLTLRNMEKSMKLLTALGKNTGASLGEVQGLKTAVEKLTDRVLTEGRLSVPELSDYLAYQLKLQIEGDDQVVCLGALEYEGSGKESAFSQALRTQVLNKLVEMEGVIRGEAPCDFTLQGFFNETDKKAFITLNLTDQEGESLAGISTKIPLEVMNFGDLKFLPTNFQYLKVLSDIKLVTKEEGYIIKKVDLFDYPIAVSASLAGLELSDIPLKLVLTQDDQVVKEEIITTDKYGKISFLLNTKEVKRSGDYVLTGSIEPETFFDLSTDSEFLQTLLLAQPPYRMERPVSILTPNVFVTSKELSNGKERSLPILAAAIKKELAVLDYQFVDEAKAADYIVEVNSITRQGQETGIARFAYLDATVSMRDLKTGREVYKYAVSNVKGAASSFSAAEGLAYDKAKDMIAKDLSFQLEFGGK